LLPLVRIACTAELLTALPVDPARWLSPSELQRLQRLQQAGRRDHYLAGHWLLRCLLAEVDQGDPAAYQLEDRPSLPPRAMDLSCDLHCTLSHSGDWIAAAIADQPIGIDIEQRWPARDSLRGFQQILLAEGEAEHSLDSDQLLQRWVLKEAWIKRHHGSALPDQLARISLRSCAADQANLILVSSTELHFALSMAGLTMAAYPVAGDATASFWCAEG